MFYVNFYLVGLSPKLDGLNQPFILFTLKFCAACLIITLML